MIINCAEQSSLFAPLSRLKENFSQTLRGIHTEYSPPSFILSPFPRLLTHFALKLSKKRREKTLKKTHEGMRRVAGKLQSLDKTI